MTPEQAPTDRNPNKTVASLRAHIRAQIVDLPRNVAISGLLPESVVPLEENLRAKLEALETFDPDMIVAEALDLRFANNQILQEELGLI